MFLEAGTDAGETGGETLLSEHKVEATQPFSAYGILG
jgi:hypothetical protein